MWHNLRKAPRFHAARYEYRATLEKIPQAKAELLPRVNFDARLRRTDQNILEREQPLFGIGRSRFKTQTWQFQASQPLFRYAAWVQLSQSRAVVRQAFAVYTAAAGSRRSRKYSLCVPASRWRYRNLPT